MKRSLSLFLTVIFIALNCFVSNGQRSQDVFVDKEGVMRWGESKKEVFGFGVNYTVPFAHAYRSGKKMNVDLEKAIEQDIYHFARLGFDAYRVHVWDTEISDSVGNLIENDHLRLFDFMIAKLKDRGIKSLITPIAFWGNGWPEPDEKTPGFSYKYGKDACLVNEDAIRAQENYLFQFLNHVNPYTKLAYKNDPDVVAFEISNEPHHRGTPAEVERYINRMVASIKNTRCAKPVFYNVSHSVHLGDAYFKSKIDGGTFQWYPTGLGSNHELRGNFLPNVDHYVMPFDNVPSFKSKAKIVYEFDAADIGRSYIYPAIARSFRGAGIQWATHFAYDPTFLAYANTEYNTHYMNLLYTPQKAISLKIAGEVFHKVPRYKQYGAYPANLKFDGFSVSYEKDLAEYVTTKKFFYTNDTETKPVDANSLEEITGFGNSSVIKYPGLGAYFLDKIEPGVWRLELYPDAIWVDNVFGKNNLNKQVAVLVDKTWPIEINLPDLATDYSFTSLKAENLKGSASGNEFDVSPGIYILIKKGKVFTINPSAKFKNIKLHEFGANAAALKTSYTLHNPIREAVAGKAVNVEAQIISQTKPDSVVGYLHNGQVSFKLNHVSGYTYEGDIQAKYLETGFLNYFITTYKDGKTITYPSACEGFPGDWNFNGTGYKIQVVPKNSPLYLFNAVGNAGEVSKEWRKGSTLIPTSPTSAVMQVEIPKLFVRDQENLNGQPIHDYSLRYNFSPDFAGRKGELSTFRNVVIKGRTLESDFPIQVAFVDTEGNTFGAIVKMDSDTDEYSFSLKDLQPVKYVTLPRPYPGFQQYFFKSSTNGKLDISKIETLQISIGPEIDASKIEVPFRLAIESIRLEK